MLASGQVLVVGDANLDLVLQGDVVPRFGQAEQLVEAADLTLGGSAALVACGLARLGVDVTLCAAVGDDLFGRHVLGLLEEHGVDRSQVVRRTDVATGLSVVLSHCERAILTHPGLGFDFAVAEECGRWNECQAYASAYAERVLVVEYRDQDFTRACEHLGSTLSIVRRNVA